MNRKLAVIECLTGRTVSEFEGSAREQVQQMILSESTPHNYCKQLFIPKDLYVRFIKEVEPIYKEHWGGLIASEKHLEYDNVLFAGCAVCLSPEEK